MAGATRNSRASSRFDPISSGTPPPRPAASAASGAAGSTSPSTVGRERQQAQRELSPPRRVRGRLHLHHQVGRGLHELVQRHGLDRLPVRRAPRARRPGSRRPSRPRPRRAYARRPRSARWPARTGPSASGMDSSVVTLIAPADSPATVTRAGSPPNAAMLSCTHRRAGQLVEQAQVGDAVVEVQEALGGQPVVDAHAHHAVPGEGRAVVVGHRRRPVHERAAVDPHQHRQPRPGPGIGRPHVQVQALLAADHHLREQRRVRGRIVPFRHRRPERRRVPLPVPCRHRLRRPHPVRPERRRRIRNPEKRQHPRRDRPADHPVPEPHHRIPRRLAHLSLHCGVRSR